MNAQNRRRHVIDLIFPISLFFVFAVSALLVLLLSVNLYRDNTSDVQENDERCAVLSYISEKLRQSDASGAVSITQREGTDCLTLSAAYNGSTYVTYIYQYEGSLKELFIKEGADVSLAGGSDIMECFGLQMETLSPGVYRFTAADESGAQTSFITSERSAS